MYAIVQHEFGPAEKLRYDAVPDPVPGLGQVGIVVAATIPPPPAPPAGDPGDEGGAEHRSDG